ncbi:MAG: mRNA surveillance protein pelota [Candidatus Aenigmatarchaeota archaeon]
MRILKKDLAHHTVTIKPERLDDLLVVEKVLDKNDIISGRTMRSIVMERDGVAVKTGKRPVFVKLAAEEMSFSSDGSELRVKGKIIESSDESSRGYHTFEIKPMEIATIEKDWKKWQIDALEKAKTRPMKILICILDEQEADFYSLTNRAEHITTLYGHAGKAFGSADIEREKYHNEVASFIREKSDKYEKIIVAGPGFAKENILKIVGDELKEKIIMDTVNHTGQPGMRELFNRKTVEKISAESEISEQTQLVERFFTEVSKDGLVVYGMDETKRCLESGAMETLFIADTLVKENDEMVGLAEQMRTTVHIINSRHEAGKRFLMFGGIGGFLRYKI